MLLHFHLFSGIASNMLFIPVTETFSETKYFTKYHVLELDLMQVTPCHHESELKINELKLLSLRHYGCFQKMQKRAACVYIV